MNSIILAAGKSSRMGFDKASVLIKKKHNVAMIAGDLERFSDKVIVVTSHNYQNITEIIKNSSCKKTVVVKNNQAEFGMFSSIKKGIENIGDENSYVFMQPVDTFGTPKKVYEELIANLDDEHHFFKPYYLFENGEKRGGHPIIIACKGIQLIKNANITENLRDIMKDSKVKYIKIDYIEILNNINTPVDLKKRGIKWKQQK